MSNGHLSRWSTSLVITEMHFKKQRDTTSLLVTAPLNKETKPIGCAYVEKDKALAHAIMEDDNSKFRGGEPAGWRPKEKLALKFRSEDPMLQMTSKDQIAGEFLLACGSQPVVPFGLSTDWMSPPPSSPCYGGQSASLNVYHFKRKRHPETPLGNIQNDT